MPTPSSLDYHPNQSDNEETLVARQARALAILADAAVTGGGGTAAVTSLPFGADEQVVSYVNGTNNVASIVFKRAGLTLATRTLSYVANGATNNDKLIGLVDAIGTAATSASGLPFGADEQVVSYVNSTNNLQSLVFKRGGVTIKTRTLIYANSGAADNDLLVGLLDS